MYFGISNHVLDAKGRIFLPSKMRAGLGDEFVVTRGLTTCISIYAAEAWPTVMASVLAVPDTDGDGQDLRRAILGNAAEVTADDQGRVPLPQHLRDFADLKREVAVVGQGELVEVWNDALWNSYSKTNLAADKISMKAQGKLPNGLLNRAPAAIPPAPADQTPTILEV